jgi:mannose-1-phosphate guanylyltransferase/mannose-6-phosphate isomerase
MASQVFPVILCGGSGTRLWPLSRAMYPKQFIPSLNGSERCLFSETVLRLAGGADVEAPTLLCNNDYRFLLQDELDRIGVTPREILLEPVARNTAPAIAVAALSIAEQSPNGVMAVMPSDHVIKNQKVFAETIARAAEIAAQGNFVLFAIKPDQPQTGYGYIRKGPALSGADDGGFRVDAFVEKPDSATAQTYLSDGNYFWNSGIFVLPVGGFVEELTRLHPEIVEHARAALAAAKGDLGFCRLDAAAYAQCPSISIDYAVMEKTSKAAMLPLDIGWSDVGSWSSVWEVSPHDVSGNVQHGDAMLVDTKNSYVQSHGAMIATLGVEDMIVVHTPDAMLVAKKDRSQDVGKLVAQLKLTNRREQEQHLRNYRPWGFFETLNLGPRFQVKLLHVKPGAQLS